MIYESLSAFASRVYCYTSFVNTAQCFPHPLSPEEERDYFRKLKEGDKKARDTLINHNLRLVAHIVKKFKNSLEADDLISVGTIGLIKAVDTFNAEKGSQFSTYASRCIENEILMLIRANKRHKDVISLNSPFINKKDGEEVPFEEILVVDDDNDYIEQFDNHFLVDRITKIIDEKLDEREREVMKLRYGLYGGDTKTQNEVAKMLGISRSYISRIEGKALKIIGEALEEHDEDGQ